MLFKITVAVTLATILFLMIIQLLKGNNLGSDKIKEKVEESPSYRDCPICGTPLKRGETVHSHLFPGKPDGMMYIFGCPYCYKDHPKRKELKNVKRICPYCKDEIPEDGWVVARVFEKPGKTHVHVLGCTVCRKVT